MSKPGKKKGQVAKPKIPAFAFSTRNKSTSAYKDRLRVLKQKYGIKFGFPANEKLTPQRKAAITRVTRKLKPYLNPENRFAFVQAPRKTIAKVKRRKAVAPQSITPKGVFVQKPVSKKRVRVRITKEGEIVERAGRRVNTYALYPSADIVQDPGIIEREAKKRGANFVFINIKGHQGKTRYSVAAFMHYVREILVPDIEEAWEDESQDSAFRKWFGVEFVRFENPKRRAKSTATHLRKKSKRS